MSFGALTTTFVLPPQISFAISYAISRIVELAAGFATLYASPSFPLSRIVSNPRTVSAV
jgi:hypothetical protein